MPFENSGNLKKSLSVTRPFENGAGCLVFDVQTSLTYLHTNIQKKRLYILITFRSKEMSFIFSQQRTRYTDETSKD